MVTEPKTSRSLYSQLPRKQSHSLTGKDYLHLLDVDHDAILCFLHHSLSMDEDIASDYRCRSDVSYSIVQDAEINDNLGAEDDWQ